DVGKRDNDAAHAVGALEGEAALVLVDRGIDVAERSTREDWIVVWRNGCLRVEVDVDLGSGDQTQGGGQPDIERDFLAGTPPGGADVDDNRKGQPGSTTAVSVTVSLQNEGNPADD